jgi:hypothetical protein
MAKGAKNRGHPVIEQWTISEIQVAGFKSIHDEQKIEIRPLTILAGANSSGKSSIMQPLLLLKQTLEAPYDAGPLLLNGPNVKFTSAEQLLSRIGKRQSLDSFQVGMHLLTGDAFVISFRKEYKTGFRIKQMEICGSSGKFNLWPEMTQNEIVKTGITKEMPFSEGAPEKHKNGQWQIGRERCFLELLWMTNVSNEISSFLGGRPGPGWEGIIPIVIHLPGLRGIPERTYPVTAVGPSYPGASYKPTFYPGTFDKYTASVISQWNDDKGAVLANLNEDLKLLKLSGGVSAVPVNDVQIELQVGRLPDVPPTRPEDRVNIADVGVGVSQTLPILVALHAAKPGQLVYVEQPETHLHPRAQFALAQIFAAAAKRGVRVVVETHSSILLLGVQTLVAEGSLEPDKVKLHWFQREKDGRTVVNSADLDEAGAFGDWPEDFDDVSLQTQARYLDAASARRLHK